jgi:hypothetical protein
MSGQTELDPAIGALLTKLQGLRDLARESGLDDLYLGLIEACALCEALANETGETVDMETLIARMESRHLHVVHDNRSKNSSRD